jgi:hypothetical protein
MTMQTKTSLKTHIWIGRALSGLVILFMLFDAIVKFIKLPEAVKTTVNELGYAEHHLFVLGLLALVATVLYAIPKTSVLGAIFLTAYLGGAIASQLRVDHPLLSNIIFPLYLALLAWAGLLLREPFLRAFLFRNPVVEQRSSDVALSKAERQFRETMA